MPTVREKMRQARDDRKTSPPSLAASRPAKGPTWAGPESNKPNGGITFSMISRWLTCRERARVRFIEGLSPPDRFDHRIEYGQMWHSCEESWAKNPKGGPTTWEGPLKEYARGLIEKYPLSQEEIEKWYRVCKVQFPVYVEYWSQSKEMADRTPLYQEQVFDVPYDLPSGRTVRLRGKWDSVDRVVVKGKGSIWLQENKTKGDIDVLDLQRQLSFDLQTNLYLIALRNTYDTMGWSSMGPLMGVRYNVVRRPLSGGEGSIKQRKGSKNVRPETADEYYARLRGVIDGTGINSDGDPYKGPSYWFQRLTAEVSATDLKRFRERCLDPILEQICCWYDEVSGRLVPQLPYTQNYQHPFGVTNSIDEYGYSDLDSYLTTGSKVGLVESPLFRELQEED